MKVQLICERSLWTSPLYPPCVSPSSCPFLGLKTEEGNAVCVWMKLKLEAEWHCSGTGKSSRLPACVCVCSAMRKGAPKLFHLGGHSSTNKTSNDSIPPKTHTGRQISTEGKTCCSSYAADLHWPHSALWILLQPQERRLFHIQLAPVTADNFSSKQQQEVTLKSTLGADEEGFKIIKEDISTFLSHLGTTLAQKQNLKAQETHHVFILILNKMFLQVTQLFFLY